MWLKDDKKYSIFQKHRADLQFRSHEVDSPARENVV